MPVIKFTVETLKKWLEGRVNGTPKEAASFCARMLNRDFTRVTDASRTSYYADEVDMVTSTRTKTDETWEIKILDYSQEGRKVSARVGIVYRNRAGKRIRTVEVMFMIELDLQGLIWKVHESVSIVQKEW